MRPSLRANVQPARIVRAVLCAVHVAMTTWIAVEYRRSEHPLVLLAVAAVPLAQASLLAIWMMWGRCRSYVRVPVAVLALTAVWAVECHCLGLELSDDRCAAYALALAVQTGVIGVQLAMLRWIRRLLGGRARQQGPARLQFSVGFVLAWVAAIGLVLGTWKFVLARAGWPWQVVQGPLFLFGAGVGFHNAALALAALAGAWWGRRGWRIAIQLPIAAALVALGAASQDDVLRAWFGTDGNVPREAWMSLAGFQVLYLLITLVPLRLVRYNRAEEVQHGTAPRKRPSDARLSDSP